MPSLRSRTDGGHRLEIEGEPNDVRSSTQMTSGMCAAAVATVGPNHAAWSLHVATLAAKTLFSRRIPAYRRYRWRVRRARHSADGGRIAPGSLLDVADDWMLLVFGVPFVLGVMALWEWQPVVAVAFVGTTVTGVLIGVVVLLRRREVES